MAGPHTHGGTDAPECTTCRNETHTDNTLRIVHAGLMDVGIEYHLAIDAIRALQNRGILFRESR